MIISTPVRINGFSQQLGLFEEMQAIPNATKNKLNFEDRRFHDWYRFVLSFPPHLVRHYLEKFNLSAGQAVLDPFCGTGTTVVESKLCGFRSVGIEANPIAYFATKVKSNWNIDPEKLENEASKISRRAKNIFRYAGLPEENEIGVGLVRSGSLLTLKLEEESLLLSDSISPVPLHKSLVLLREINKVVDIESRNVLLLALAKVLVQDFSNLHFGPEVGVSKRKKLNVDASGTWLKQVRIMADDIRTVKIHGMPTATVVLGDSRNLGSIVDRESIDAVFTSPPYPNEKDYTRTTRLESVVLGFIKSKEELRGLKRGLVRSNTRGVYKADIDDQWVKNNKRIQRIVAEIERRRIKMKKTSGFERLYHRVTSLYFGGMAKHLEEMKSILRPGAYLGYVVGDQASYLRVLIETGQLLAEIAESLGYQVVGLDLFRTRIATATKVQMREEVLLLKWPGP